MPTEIIKVCGITRPADAIAAAGCGATAIGMVFYRRSPRAVRFHEAAMISAVVPPGVLKVGVFVNEEPAEIRKLVEVARLDVVQLHGDEKPADLKPLEGLRVWRALPVGPDFEPQSLEQWPVEAVLLDAPSGEAYGGSGRQFPWAKAVEAKRYQERILVAGGLDGSNVTQAVREVAPWGVDSSSRLESSPGVKDEVKVQAYVQAALAASAPLA